jgi:hypothetical protein
MLSAAKHLVFLVTYENEILRLPPQDDIETQPLARHRPQSASRFDFHLPRENLLVRASAPGDVACRAVEIRKIIERDERHILHENFSRLLEQRNPLLGILSFLLLFDQLIERRVTVVHSLRGSRPKILIVESVSVNQAASADIIKRELAAVDSGEPPENRLLLRNEFDLESAFFHLSGNHLADFPIPGESAGR